MPLYEFRCETCDNVIERLCRVGTNGKGLKCPMCGGGKMRRLMSVFSARTKGESGGATSVGSSCASCSSGNCATCH
ncbi:MAG: zinc ribbon domain-containing protein [Armatimonadota bacterium]|nr:zinc ribbon domain-containing protein [Armatimonadota bacterium]